jgi:hypothetical protein
MISTGVEFLRRRIYEKSEILFLLILQDNRIYNMEILLISFIWRQASAESL